MNEIWTSTFDHAIKYHLTCKICNFLKLLSPKYYILEPFSYSYIEPYRKRGKGIEKEWQDLLTGVLTP